MRVLFLRQCFYVFTGVNMRRDKFKDIRMWVRELRELLKSNSLFAFKGKGDYLFLTRDKNKDLFKVLEKSGFFLLHKTNLKKRIVGLHQIVLYAWEGYKILIWGGSIKRNQIEIHHIDHNPSNNSRDNLAYTTPHNNKAIAVIVSYVCNVKAEYFNAEVKFDLDRVNIYKGDFINLLFKSLKAAKRLIKKDVVKDFFNSIPYIQAKRLGEMLQYKL